MAVCVAVALAASAAPSIAQSTGIGTIRGTVFDIDFEVPIEDVRVAVVELDRSTKTTPDGVFRFENVPAGRYTLTVRKSGYEREVVTGVIVTPGRVADVRVDIGVEVIEMEELVVTGEDFLASTEIGLLDIRATAVTLQDAISAELISKAGAGDVAGALKLVVGASVVEGKYATVRGLSDRYTGTTLNGVRVPSADPRKRAVQVDLFPTGTIDSVTVTKTFTPDLQGDFTGGGVEIKTKSIPDDTILNVSISSEYDTLATGNDAFLTYEGGGVDTTGYGGDARDWPTLLKNPIREPAPRPSTRWNFEYPEVGTAQGDVLTSNIELARAYDAQTRAFPSVISTSEEAPGYNSGLSLVFGDNYGVGGAGSTFRIGVLGAVTYSRKNSYSGEGFNNNVSVSSFAFDPRTGEPAIDPETGEPVGGDYTVDDFRRERRGKQEVLLGALGTIVAQPDENHEIALRLVGNQAAEDEARFLEEDVGTTDRFIRIVQNQSMNYVERTLRSWQLDGRHTLVDAVDFMPGFSDLVVDWVFSDNYTRQFQPDNRFFLNGVEYDLELGFGSATPGVDAAGDADLRRRIFRDIDERNDQLALDLELPFEQWNEEKGSVKFGWIDDRTDRTFDQLSYTYSIDSQVGTSNPVVAQNNRLLGETQPFPEGAGPDFLYSTLFLSPERIGLAPERCPYPVAFDDLERWIGPFIRRPQFKRVEADCASPDQLLFYARPIGTDVDYTAEQRIDAYYAMADLPVHPDVRLIFGARQESTFIDIVPVDSVDAENTLETVFVQVVRDPATGELTQINRGLSDAPPEDLASRIDEDATLPAFAVVYEPVDAMKVRGSWSRTLARPTFRELAPVATIEFLFGDQYFGNPDLTTSSITNYDLRWEWFPRPGDVLAVSAFSKEIENPIELISYTLNQGRAFIQPVNYPEGEIEGFEIEARTGLDVVWGGLTGLAVGVNYAFIDSQVTVPELERFALRGTPFQDQDVRRLQGQPENLFNANVTYDNERTGTSASVFYNRIGETLVTGAAKGGDEGARADLFEQPIETLDFKVSQAFGAEDRFSVSVKGSNLLEPDRVQTYRLPNGDEQERVRRQTAARYGVSLSWKW